MKISLLTLLIWLPYLLIHAQNVGIGTTVPIEKLDVNGNVNIRGTIKANGTDGVPGQVIARNSSGSIEWKTLGGNEDTFETYLATTNGTSQSFVVPAGVTQIVAEAWAGGGSGGVLVGLLSAGSGGGGGGGYIKAVFTVVPGSTVNIVVGLGATATMLASGSSIVVGSTTITALPGTNAQVTAGLMTDVFLPGTGGLFSVNNPSFRRFTFAKGADGEPVIYKAFPVLSGSSVIYANDFSWGKGGSGGNSTNTGGVGGQAISGDKFVSTFFTYHSALGSAGGVPGGGGGGDRQRVNAGGNGLVIIHY